MQQRCERLSRASPVAARSELTACQDGEGRTTELNEREKAFAALRAEGDALSKKNAESQQAARKLRQSLRDCEAERDGLAVRLQSLELEAEQRRDDERSNAMNTQVRRPQMGSVLSSSSLAGCWPQGAA